MSRALFISHGVDPVLVNFDFVNETHQAFFEGVRYQWSKDTFPFSLEDGCVDGSLLRAYADWCVK